MSHGSARSCILCGCIFIGTHQVAAALEAADDSSDITPGVVTVTATRVSKSARASLSNFGADVALGGSVFACGLFDLEGEPLKGSAFSFRPLSSNVCGCPDATKECVVLSSGLAPPDALQ